MCRLFKPQNVKFDESDVSTPLDAFLHVYNKAYVKNRPLRVLVTHMWDWKAFFQPQILPVQGITSCHAFMVSYRKNPERVKLPGTQGALSFYDPPAADDVIADALPGVHCMVRRCPLCSSRASRTLIDVLRRVGGAGWLAMDRR